MRVCWKSVGFAVAPLVLAVSLSLDVPVVVLPLAAIAQTPNDRKAEVDRWFEQGNKLLEQNQNEGAIAAFQKALVIYRELKERQKEGQTLKAIGNVYLSNLKDYPKAVDYQQQALEIAREIKDFDLQARTLNNIGIAYQRMGKAGQGIPYLQEAIAVAQASQNHFMAVLASSNLGESYEKFGQIEQAIATHKQALAIARQFLNGSQSEFDALVGLANVTLNDYPTASKYAEEAVALARTLNKPALLRGLIMLNGVRNNAAIQINLDTIEDHDAKLRGKKQIEEYTHLVLQSIREAIRLAQELKDVLKEANAYLLLGTAYLYSGDFAQSLQSYNQAAVMYRQLNQLDQEAKAYSLEAAAYLYSGDFAQSLQSYNQAAVIYRRLNQPNDLYTILMQMIRVHFSANSVAQKKEHYPEALTAVDQMLQLTPEAFHLAKSLNNKAFEKEVRYYEATAYTQISNVYLTLKDFQKAEAASQKARNIARTSENWQAENDALTWLTSIYSSQGDYYKVIAINQRQTELAQKIGNPVNEVYALLNLASSYGIFGNAQQQIEMAQQALEKARFIDPAKLPASQRDQPLQTQMLALRGLSTAYPNLGKYREARHVLEQWISLARQTNDWQNQVAALTDLSQLEATQQELIPALQSAQQALQIAQNCPQATTQKEILAGTEAEIEATIQVSNIYIALEKYPQALDMAQQALQLAQESHDPGLQVSALSILSNVYGAQRNIPKMLERLQQAVTLAEQLPNWRERFGVLITLGRIYQSLGDYQTSRNLFQKTLTSAQAKQDEHIESQAQIQLAGNAFLANQPPPRIIELAEKSLQLAQGKTPLTEANAQATLALAYAEAGNDTKAMTAANAYLAIAHQLQSPGMESYARHLLGDLNRHFGRLAAALESYQAALAIPRQKNDENSGILVGLAQIYAGRNQPATAIAFYKKAINGIEKSRRNLQGLSTDLQKSFLQTTFDFGGVKTADIYRQLADVLISQGRIAEAQQVLELLKLKELDDFTHTTRSGEKSQGIALSQVEAKIIQDNGTLIAFGQKLTDCQGKHTTDCDSLRDQLTALTAQYNAAIRTLEADLRKRSAADEEFINPNSQFGKAAATLIKENPDTLLVYPLVLEDKLWLLMAGQGGILKKFEVKVKRKTLSDTVRQFRDLLQNPHSDLTKLQTTSHQLYTWLIQPLETELNTKRANQPTIHNLVFALDRVTRYIPMAALFDGKQYLLEHYTVSTIVAASFGNNRDRTPLTPPTSKALAMGVSAAPNFPPLPNVKSELAAIVQTRDRATSGIYPGQEFLDQAFDFRALQNNLTGYRILHIATHGKFEPGNAYASYLIMGKGDKLKIADIQNLPNLGDINLVTLSACETALGGNGDGIEITGISSYFLSKGAQAVTASLWSVNDSSTSLLMQQFYKNLATGKLTKSEALRQAQLSLLQGRSAPGSSPANREADAVLTLKPGARLPSSPTDFSHPYYWAPFILIGNGL